MNVLKRSLLLINHCVTRRVLLDKSRFISSAIRPFYTPILPWNSVLCVDVQPQRKYSKSKDRGKDKKKGTAKVEIDKNQLAKYLDIDAVKAEHDDIFTKMKEEFAANLSLRSSVGSIETIKVHYEGKIYELQEVAQIVRQNPKTVILNIASIPQVIPEVLKALERSGLNLNPQQDGTTVYIPVPKVTKEHREALAKNAKVMFNARKIEMKQIPMKCFRKLSSVGNTISEDTVHAVRKQILAMNETYVEELRCFYMKKAAELGTNTA